METSGAAASSEDGVTAPKLPTRDDVPYASHYCEENAYKLIEILYNEFLLPDDSVFAVFISNPQKCVFLWMQRLGEEAMQNLVVWDYHVIVLVNRAPGGVWLVFDYDSLLPYPCAADRYVMMSFRPDINLEQNQRQWFRVVHGRAYLASFSSDRSHMAKSNFPPPPWPPIRGALASDAMRLSLYWDMTRRDEQDGDVSATHVTGKVMDIYELVAFISPSKSVAS